MSDRDDCPASITPDTRVGELLDRWPQLEAVLVGLSPRYGALKNPVLRRTVAKIATLRQVAAVGGVSLARLIGSLREAVGLAPAVVAEASAEAPGPPPAWAVEAAVTRRHDARAAIEAGEHPLRKVMEDLATLGETDVYELVTPFVPAPLVDVACEKGFASFSASSDAEHVVRTWFRRAG